MDLTRAEKRCIRYLDRVGSATEATMQQDGCDLGPETIYHLEAERVIERIIEGSAFYWLTSRYGQDAARQVAREDERCQRG